MNELFVPYEIAQELVNKGFDKECLGYYEANTNKLIITNMTVYALDKYKLGIVAPIYDQVTAWFLTKDMYLDVNVAPIYFEKDACYKYQFVIDKPSIGDYIFHSADTRMFYKEHQEAKLQAIITALTLI